MRVLLLGIFWDYFGSKHFFSQFGVFEVIENAVCVVLLLSDLSHRL